MTWEPLPSRPKRVRAAMEKILAGIEQRRYKGDIKTLGYGTQAATVWIDGVTYTLTLTHEIGG